jgi:hypothetical protein
MTVRKASLVTVTGAQHQVLIPIHIRSLAEFLPKDGLESGFDIKSEISVPVLCTLSSTKGIHKFDADHWSLLDIDAKLRSELDSTLGSRGDYPEVNRKQAEE